MSGRVAPPKSGRSIRKCHLILPSNRVIGVAGPPKLRPLHTGRLRRAPTSRHSRSLTAFQPDQPRRQQSDRVMRVAELLLVGGDDIHRIDGDTALLIGHYILHVRARRKLRL